MNQEAIVVPKAKPRTKRAVAIADGSDPSGPLKLKQTEKAKMQRMYQKLNEISQQLNDSIARINDDSLQQMIPHFLIRRAEQQLLWIRGEESALASILTESRCQNALAVIEKVKEKLTAATKVSTSLDTVIEKAVEHSKTEKE